MAEARTEVRLSHLARIDIFNIIRDLEIRDIFKTWRSHDAAPLNAAVSRSIIALCRGSLTIFLPVRSVT